MPAPFAENPEFTKLLAKRDDEVDLVRLMLEFAGDAYPALNPRDILAELEQLGEQARDEVSHVAADGIAAQLEAVAALLHDRHAFRGNQDAYYDPRNSYLNEVLARHLGIPISLSLLYIAVGRLAGLKVYGVGTPGHFVVGCADAGDAGDALYIDPFTDGAVLDFVRCRERIKSVLGPEAELNRAHFRPATPLEIAARVLRNLKAAYAMQNSWAAALPVQRRLTALLPDVLDERRDLGLIYLRNSEPHAAVQHLEAYVKQADAESVEAVVPFLRTARRLAAERN